MKKTLFALSLICSLASAKALIIEHGIVKAHTEVFGDSKINPQTNVIVSHLTMNNGIESIHGGIDVSVLKLKSDNTKRDKHMVKAIESEHFPIVHYTFEQITPDGDGYTIAGMLTFHGVTRPLQFHANITETGNKLEIKAKSYIKLSDYKVKPIKLLFLTVRNRIDLNVDALFKEK